MDYREFMLKNLSQLVEKVREPDVYDMIPCQYSFALDIINKRITAFRGVLQKCSNPDTMKGCEERKALIKYAKIELNAGERLLRLFMADCRFEYVDKFLRETNDNYKKSIDQWDDFIRYCESRKANKDKDKHKGKGSRK